VGKYAYHRYIVNSEYHATPNVFLGKNKRNKQASSNFVQVEP